MKDPQKAIIQAVYDALQGLALPVYATLPLGLDEYVLLSQPTLVEGRGSQACEAWDATLLVSVYTKFERGQADLEPALDVSAEVMARLKGERLDLGEFSTGPVELQRLSLPQRYDEVNVYVQDTLRLRFEVYGEPTVVPRGQTVNDFTPAQIQADYAQLAALEALVCPRDVYGHFVFDQDSGNSISVQLGSPQFPVTHLIGVTTDTTGATFTATVGGHDITSGWVGSAGDVVVVTRLAGDQVVKISAVA